MAGRRKLRQVLRESKKRGKTGILVVRSQISCGVGGLTTVRSLRIRTVLSLQWFAVCAIREREFATVLSLQWFAVCAIREREFATAMALSDDRRLSFVAQIDTSVGMWTVKVQVVECHRMQESNAKSDGQKKFYKRYLLVDEQGTKVSGVLYDNDIQYFSNSLKPFQRYLISNAKLTPAFAYFKVGPYAFSWIITDETPVELVDEPIPPPLPFTYDVCPFNEFINHADKEFGFHVKAIVVHAFPRRQVKPDTSHREFVVVDESKMPMIMTLWNSYGDVEGNAIANNIGNLPVVIAVNMKATTFHGLSLATRMYSCILVDPPLADSPSLKDWYYQNRAEITKLLDEQAYKNTDLLLPPPALGATIDVPTAATTLLKNHSAWVVGKIHFTATEQPYYIVACQNCHKKVSAAPKWLLTCSFCGERIEVQLRCRVPIELVGGNKSLPLTLTTPDVEHLTGITAEQLRDSHQFDSHVEDDLQITLDKLQVVCFVKRYDRSTLGTPGRHGIRYAVVKVYRMEVIQPSGALTASSSAAVDLGATDDDKQLFTPNTKRVLTELECTDEANRKAGHPAPSAKRSLEYVSSPNKAATTVDVTDSSAEFVAVPGGQTEAEDLGKSPVKKGRDKVKLN